MSSAGHRLKCPRCGAVYTYTSEKIDQSSSVECQNCTMQFSIEMQTEGLEMIPIGDSDAIQPSEEFTRETVEGIRIECPSCNSKYLYKNEQISSEGKVNCQNCGKAVEAVGEDVIIVKEQTIPGTSEDWTFVILIIIILLFVPWWLAIPLIIGILIYRDQQSGRQESRIIRRDKQGPGPR